MAAHKSISNPRIAIICIFLLAFTTKFAVSARTLNEEEPDTAETPVSNVTPVVATTPAGPASATGAGAGAGAGVGAGAGATVAKSDGLHALSFFMHDIIGGTNPSARAVTGVVTNPAVNGQVPFAKPNGAVASVDNGIPQNNNNNGIINNNNVPFFTGLSGVASNVIQSSRNGIIGGNGFPFLNGAMLPSGTSLQKLTFGTLTVFDDELTEGHELGSGLIGKAQGFYVASSVDGTSQTMAFTTMFQEGGYANSLTFFGVYRTAVSESHLAVMGGTGKYVNAKGFATVKTFPVTDQHTDGIETLLHFAVYLTY